MIVLQCILTSVEICFGSFVIVTLLRGLSEAGAYTSVHSQTDYISSSIDVTFLVQMPGLSGGDIQHVRALMIQTADVMTNIGPSIDSDSQLRVVFFGEHIDEPISLGDCCQFGVFDLRNKIYEYVSLTEIGRRIPESDVTSADGSRTDINILNAFHYIHEKQIIEGRPKQKPSLIVFISNIQSPFTNDAAYNDAYSQVILCKQNNTLLITVIINHHRIVLPRKRRSSTKYLTKSQILMKARKEFLMKNTNLFPLQQPFLNMSEQVEPIMVYSEDDEEEIINLYAKEFASSPQYAFVYPEYEFLMHSPVVDAITNAISNAMEWASEIEVRGTCKGTYHVTGQEIWSPGYHNGQYPAGVKCSWYLTARFAQRLVLTVKMIDMEKKLDQVVIYDGHLEHHDSMIETYSGVGENLTQVNSTQDKMLIVFQSDGVNNYHGFLAIYGCIENYQKLASLDVVFLVDSSSSISGGKLVKVKNWLNHFIKYLYFGDDIEVSDSHEKGRVGLVTFDQQPSVIVSLLGKATRSNVTESIDKLDSKLLPTYLGEALDWVRMKQFYDVREYEENVLSEDVRLSSSNQLLIIISDGRTLDDVLKPAARLCQNNIIPVFIGVGNVNLKVQNAILRHCGTAFPIDTSIPEVIDRIRHKEPVDEPPVEIPSTTTTTTSPPETSTTTATTVTTQPTEPYIPQKFHYDGFLIFLFVVAFIELLVLLALCHFYSIFSTDTSEWHSHRDNSPDDVTPDSHYVKSFEGSETSNFVVNKTDSDLELVPTNSFFVKNLFKANFANKIH